MLKYIFRFINTVVSVLIQIVIYFLGKRSMLTDFLILIPLYLAMYLLLHQEDV